MDIEKLMLPIAEFTEYGEVCFAHLSENGERNTARTYGTLSEILERDCEKEKN